MPEKKKPHRHVPARDGEQYTELGAWWQRPFCECGKELSPRRVSWVGTGAAPATKKGRGR